MDGDRRRDRLRSFALGSLVGISAGLAATRRVRRRRPTKRMQAGLAAFEDAPCFHERVERQARDARSRAHQ
jgi:hypothetical protein